MDLIVGLYDEIVMFLVFLFGRFSKGGFRKLYFFVKFSNEIHRFYIILRNATKSCNKFVKYSSSFILYVIIYPTAITLFVFIITGLFFLTDTSSEKETILHKETNYGDFVLPL